MTYKISKKIVGTNTVEVLANIKTDNPIVDMCWVEDIGLVFTHGHHLGLVDFNGQCDPFWMGNDIEGGNYTDKRDGTVPIFGRLSGIGYLASIRLLFIGEDEGRNIRVIDIKKGYTNSLIQKYNADCIAKLLKNTPEETPVWISPVGRNRVFIAYPSLRKCYFYNSDSFHHIAGDGLCRYSNGVKATITSIGIPSSLAFRDKSLLIADSLNGVVRSLNGSTLDLIVGNPLNSTLQSPSKIVVQGGSLFILCKNAVYSFLFKQNAYSYKPIYEDNNIVNITCDNNKSLFIMEEFDANS